ncbi:MAG: 2-isopropylmalate synthase [Spirochaetia bacterium]|nr:2-isopropylmalate synthase [Spirochaetia bacterium]
MAERVILFDTTLRDGEQAPGYSMNLDEKVRLAKQLEALQVDVIEAGFAIASDGDFKAIEAVASAVKECTVASLSRALQKDIDASWSALRTAARPRIHTFIATSPIHMQYKLKMDSADVLDQAVRMVTYARNLCGDVEFSAEDASRSDWEFLYRICEAVIDAGASTVNIPDTVGYTTPDEYAALIRGIREHVPNIDKAVISVHCHNDLGLAVANTLAAAKAGATQLECTVNGIGERAGNAAVEELAMVLNTRKDYYQLECGIKTSEIYRTSRLLSSITGVAVQPNKAIVGANAFAHESGIHQHGILAHTQTYEIMTPASIGLHTNTMVLGKHSGRHAFVDHVKALGYDTEDKSIIDEVFTQFKQLADRKKSVSEKDIEALMENRTTAVPATYALESFVINSGNRMTATASLTLKFGKRLLSDVSTGDGPVDAAFRAIERITGFSYTLEDYTIHAVTGGKDAQGEVSVRIQADGRTYKGRGVSTDVIEASIKACLSAVNRLAYEVNHE